MGNFFDPNFDILMNEASHFEKPQKNLPKFYLLEIDIWKRQFVLYQTLISFFHTGKLFHPKFWYDKELIQ